MIIITVVVSLLLILLVYLAISGNKDCGCSSKDEENYSNTENINNKQ